MTQQNKSTTLPVRRAALAKRMFLGAGIALILISIFLASAGQPDPAWPKFWMLKPLLIVPLAGALGGLFYYYMSLLGAVGGRRKTLAILLSIVVYIIGLWMGTVLGLEGTMWD